MKNITCLALLIFGCMFAEAQSPVHFNIGIKAGAQAAKLGQDEINWDTKYRWHAGLLAHLHFSKHFAIQPELVYSAQGAEHISPVTNTQLKLDYLNLPIVFQYMTGTGFRFQAGPQIGLLLKAKGKNNGVESDVKEYFKKTDLSVLAGISYITKLGLGFDARYVYGLTDIVKDNAGLGSDINNLVIQLGAFYQFKHK